MGPATAGSTSSSLIRQVQKNEPDAWDRLCSLYAPLVVDWCRQAGLQPADTADVVQEVFVAVYQNVVGFRRERPGDSFRGWLWTVARNAVRLHFRKAAQTAVAAGGSHAQAALGQVPQYFEEPSQPDSAAQRHALLHRALQLLRPQCAETTWRAFWRTTVDGMPGPDVASELGISAGAVRQAKYAVLQRLRDLLADE